MNNLTTTTGGLSEIVLSYKSKVKASSRPKVSNSKDAYNLLIRQWDPSKVEFVEQFKILLLNRAHKAIGEYEVSTGGSTATIADPKLIFAAAIKSNASGIILAHNHPSGNLTPSDADIGLTKRIVDAGKLLEITVLDHLILTSESYYSFADDGLI
jgi:DNA repair protein RadC